jgi:hypothetical protein
MTAFTAFPIANVNIPALPDLGAVSDAVLLIAERSGTGRVTAASLRDYVSASFGISSGGPFLSLSGGTMAGPLYLAADPGAPAQAATKGYVDAVVGTGGGPFLPLTGGTVSGATTFSATGMALTVSNNASVRGTASLGGGSTNYVNVTGAAANPTIQVAGTGNGTMLLRGLGTGGINLGSTTSGNVLQLLPAASNTDAFTMFQPTALGQPGILDMLQAGTGGIYIRSFLSIGKPLTLNNQASTVWLAAGNNLSGTTNTNYVSLFTFGSNSDAVLANGGAGSVVVVDATHRMATGWQGGRVGLNASLFDTGPATAHAHNIMVAVNGLSSANYNQGGVAAGFGVSQFGMGGNFGGVFGIGLAAGATYMRGGTGIEIDVHNLAGSSNSSTVGMQIVHDGAHAVQGINLDVAFRIGDQSTALIGWKNLIILGSYDSKWPCDPNGYLLQIQPSYSGAAASAAGGIDLQQFVPSGTGPEGGGFALRTSGTFGATAIDSSGFVKVGTGLISASAAGLIVDVPLWTLSGTPTIGAGGTGFSAGDIVADGLGNIFSVGAVTAGAVTAVTVRQRGEGRAADASGTITCTTRSRNGTSLGTGLTLVEAWAQSTRTLSLQPSGGAIVMPLLTNAANDAAAAGAGVAVGQVYRNGSAVMQRVA